MTKSLRVDPGGLGIALAALPLGVAVGLGQNHGTLAVGISPDAFSFLSAAGSEFHSHPQPLGPHPVEDRRADIRRQIDALDPHVHGGDAQMRGLLPERLAQNSHDLLAIGRQHLLNGAAAKFAAQAVLDDLVEPNIGLAGVATHRRVVAPHVLDPPHDERIHDHVLFLGGQEPFRVGVQGL